MDTVEIPLELWRGLVELCFTEMPNHYVGDGWAVVEWRLSGRAEGRWQLVLRGDSCQVVRDGDLHPDVCLRATDEDFVAICLGQADPRRLTMRRRLRPRGNLLVAARVAKWFRPPAAAR